MQYLLKVNGLTIKWIFILNMFTLSGYLSGKKEVSSKSFEAIFLFNNNEDYGDICLDSYKQ